MGNHDLSDYLRRIMLALCSRGVPAQPPICADSGQPKYPGNCWNVRCQLGGTCCRTSGVGVLDGNTFSPTHADKGSK
jgi:hypothetical protein